MFLTRSTKQECMWSCLRAGAGRREPKTKQNNRKTKSYDEDNYGNREEEAPEFDRYRKITLVTCDREYD